MSDTPTKYVLIPCQVARGAFPGESLVTVDTVDGPVSGFVRTEDIVHNEDGENCLIGLVKDIKDDILVVYLKGSFFTTTGITYIPKDKAVELCA
jgi:hypothetical protein